ncbi:MAG: social motility TPR repeat lipoprotein Tgl [Archangiaceae bacterium]|nr:social motility TPR repeat lipoprotein Tgl [Archangiaceae bacterium]
MPARPGSQGGVKPQGAQQAQAQAAKSTSASAIGKLFGSFVLAWGWLLLSCAHVATEKEQREAQAHYDLAANMMQKEPQAALIELDRALALDPDMPEANNARGVLLHLAFNHPEDAIASYRKALQVRPAFSECKVNLGNVYLDQKRYDEAIPLYREALNDMLYPTPFVAQGNLGWALYKKGDTEQALSSIKSAVTLNPKFCLGYRNLGTIYDEKGAVDDACHAYGKFRELCPEVADAYLREGVCLAKKGDLAGAHKSLQGCLEKSRVDSEREDCRRLKEGLGPPPAAPQAPPEAGGR